MTGFGNKRLYCRRKEVGLRSAICELRMCLAESICCRLSCFAGSTGTPFTIGKASAVPHRQDVARVELSFLSEEISFLKQGLCNERYGIHRYLFVEFD